jgi:hypothetical protein
MDEKGGTVASGVGTRAATGANSAGGEEDTAALAALDRIGSKLERLSAQRKALRRAMREFGREFDADTWADAFISPDSDDINRVFAVTGGYLALVNNTAEAVKAGAKLAGMSPTAGILGVPGLIDAIRLDGGFSDRQAETFVELYRTRNRLQHSSPDIEADEMHRQVRALLCHLPGFIKSYLAWLQKHDIRL